LSLQLDPDARPDSLSAKLINRDLQSVPGIAPSGGLDIVSVTLVESEGKRLRIEADTGSAGAPDLFAAGPEGSYIALPKLAEGETGNPVWHLSTKGLKTTTSDSSLRLVLSDGNHALEHLAPIQPDWLD
jgi:DsbC/DsbD-like thiol-disulfide interchange protein